MIINITYFFKNIWNFRKELWNFRSWDYDFSLHMFQRSLQLLNDSIQEHSNEVLESRHLKVKAIQRVLFLLDKKEIEIEELTQQEWDELWTIIKGTNKEEFDGSDIRTWWH